MIAAVVFWFFAAFTSAEAYMAKKMKEGKMDTFVDILEDESTVSPMASIVSPLAGPLLEREASREVKHEGRRSNDHL